MTKTILLATTAVLLTAGAAAAQSPTQPAPQAEASQQGVLVFTPDFFAEQRPNTALDMINRVPGFAINDGDGSRGFEGSVGNVLINGSRPASKTDTGTNVLGRTLASQVERIELIRGGAPGIDMQGYSVVVNVITKGGSSRQSILTGNLVFFEGGHDAYGVNYQFSARNGDHSWGVVLSDGYSTSDSNGMGPVVRVGGDGSVQNLGTFFNDSWGGGNAIRANYSGPLFGGKIDLTGRLGVSDWHSLARQDAPDSLRDSRYDEDGNEGEVGVVFTRPLGPRLSLETRFIHQFDSFEEESLSKKRVGGVDDPEELFTTEYDSSETILRSLVRFERSAGLTFEAGGEIAYNMLDTRQAYSEGGVPIPLPSASVKVEETRGEAFGKITWRASDRLTVEGGLRFEASTISQSGDADTEKSLYYAKPRLLLTWTPMPNNQLRFRFERDVGQLDFSDFAASADLDDENVLGGNIDLEPEQRWISELIYERRFWKDGIVSIGYRHDEIVDAIDRIPLENNLSAVGNIGDGTLDQLVVNVLVPMDRFGFTGGRIQFRNTWNKTEVTDPTSGQTRPISDVRRSQPNIGISQDIPSWKLQWGANWITVLGQMSYQPDQNFGWSGRNYYEAWAEYKPTPTLAIRAQVNVWNDFDVERTVFADRLTRPISYVETRFIDPRTFWQIRLRKTF